MERISRFRVRILSVLFALVMAFFAFRLYDLQVIRTGGVIDNTTTFTTLTRVKAARGDILDRNGNLLVSNRASYDLVINHYVLITADGTIIRIPVSSISVLRRDTQGVRVMRVGDSRIISVAPSEAEDEDEGAVDILPEGEANKESDAPDALDRLVDDLEANPEPNPDDEI